MTRRIAPPLLIALLLLTGCGASKLQTAYATRSMYNTAVEEVMSLHKAGVVSDEQLVASEPFVNAVPPLLDELDKAAMTGNAFDWASALKNSRTSLDKLIEWIVKSRKN